MNIPMANAITYAASAQGTRNVFASIGRNLRSYADPAAPMPMFSGLDRAAAMDQEAPETPR
jgi:hypothetical protein